MATSKSRRETTNKVLNAERKKKNMGAKNKKNNKARLNKLSLSFSLALCVRVAVSRCSLRCCFFRLARSLVFSSVVTTADSPLLATCHVKINQRSGGDPPFFHSTCGVFCLPAGPYSAACRPTFLLAFLSPFFCLCLGR